MDYFTKKRLGLWAIVALLTAFNLGTVTYVWMLPKRLHGQPPRRPMPQFDPTSDFLIRELGLDASQQEALLQMRQAHFEQVHERQRDLQPIRHEFFKHFSDVQVDTTEIQGFAERIAKGQQQLEWEMFKHFRDIRALCRPDQQPQFDRVVFDALKMMTPPPPGVFGRPRRPMPPR